MQRACALPHRRRAHHRPLALSLSLSLSARHVGGGGNWTRRQLIPLTHQAQQRQDDREARHFVFLLCSSAWRESDLGGDDARFRKRRCGCDAARIGELLTKQAFAPRACANEGLREEEGEEAATAGCVCTRAGVTALVGGGAQGSSSSAAASFRAACVSQCPFLHARARVCSTTH